jgi:hypothetical protein
MSGSAICLSNTSTTAAAQNRNVYVASLPLHFDDQQLHNLFSPYGRIISARIMRAKKSHLSKGYGFVMYREASAAEQAIQALHGSVISGARIQVRWASADASTTFSKASHTSTSATGSSANTSTDTSAACPTSHSSTLSYPSAVTNAHVMQALPTATNVYTPPVLSQAAYRFVAPAVPYEHQPHSGANPIAFHQNYATLLNSPLMPAQSSNHGSVLRTAFAPLQSPPQPMSAPLPSTPPPPPPQHVYVMVLPNGERHIVQLNQLTYQNV